MREDDQLDGYDGDDDDQRGDRINGGDKGELS
jgi:hypothetical protein